MDNMLYAVCKRVRAWVVFLRIRDRSKGVFDGFRAYANLLFHPTDHTPPYTVYLQYFVPRRISAHNHIHAMRLGLMDPDTSNTQNTVSHTHQIPHRDRIP
uniref:Uncharacterized protein n=1 Tax=Candidatus Methanogaster sp. ANME-2c ERB4 TaxID=2759911 RepID=A0A7G9YF19_9EURY|nr:hypothetical protein IJOKCNEH_00001 [Methanosarcinales archaeon ANME-2c ERB4]